MSNFVSCSNCSLNGSMFSQVFNLKHCNIELEIVLLLIIIAGVSDGKVEYYNCKTTCNGQVLPAYVPPTAAVPKPIRPMVEPKVLRTTASTVSTRSSTTPSTTTLPLCDEIGSDGLNGTGSDYNTTGEPLCRNFEASDTHELINVLEPSNADQYSVADQGLNRTDIEPGFQIKNQTNSSIETVEGESRRRRATLSQYKRCKTICEVRIQPALMCHRCNGSECGKGMGLQACTPDQACWVKVHTDHVNHNRSFTFKGCASDYDCEVHLSTFCRGYRAVEDCGFCCKQSFCNTKMQFFVERSDGDKNKLNYFTFITILSCFFISSVNDIN